MGSNYLQRQKERDRNVEYATRQTMLQFMTDVVEITLNNPEAMGGHAFGVQKIKQFLKCLGECYDDYIVALCPSEPEVDYVRIRLEGRLEQLFGKDGYVPFHERYDFIDKLPEIGGKKR